jgi:two-component system cell cycle response regulator CtrA
VSRCVFAARGELGRLFAFRLVTMRALLIEHDPATAQSIELMLIFEGWTVYATDSGEEGVDLAKLYDYDIVLLDLTPPDISGYDVLRALRDARVQTPALVLSGLSGVEDKVRAFALGADDFLVKPFHKDELVARMTAIVRRARGFAHAAITAGALVVDLDQKSAAIGGARLALTAKEYQLLELLALRKGAVVSREMILNHVYGGLDEPEMKIIDVFACKLRKKLALADPDHDYIETVWGRGFMLRETPLRRGEPVRDAA